MQRSNWWGNVFNNHDFSLFQCLRKALANVHTQNKTPFPFSLQKISWDFLCVQGTCLQVSIMLHFLDRFNQIYPLKYM